MQNADGQGDGRRLILTNGVVVTPTAAIDRGTVVVEDARIVAVQEGTYPARDTTTERVVDVGGQFVLPGIVCLHNDGVEKAIHPRPNTNFPRAFALQTYDAALAAAGVTTQFHAVSFLNVSGKNRSVSGAVDLCHDIRAFAESGRGSLDHYILFRCDVRQDGSLDAVLSCLDDSPVPLVSMNDHVPGQGQYINIEKYREQMKPYLPPEMQNDAGFATWLQEREQFKEDSDHFVEIVYNRIAIEARSRGLILASHDDDTREKVEAMHGIGCTIAEFPVRLDAARRARELGMHVAIGAPNAVRGGSLTGNIGAMELAAAGLVDIFIADYHAPSILYAAWLCVQQGIVTLPEAVAMCSINPAAAAHLTDRGAIVPGLRADMIVVRESDGVPTVSTHIVAGRVQFERTGSGHVTATRPTGAAVA